MNFELMSEFANEITGKREETHPLSKKSKEKNWTWFFYELTNCLLLWRNLQTQDRKKGQSRRHLLTHQCSINRKWKHIKSSKLWCGWFHKFNSGWHRKKSFLFAFVLAASTKHWKLYKKLSSKEIFSFFSNRTAIRSLWESEVIEGFQPENME